MLLGKFILNHAKADSQQNRKVIQPSMTKTTSNMLLFRRFYFVIFMKSEETIVLTLLFLLSQHIVSNLLFVFLLLGYYVWTIR